jgi:methionyl-tRNA formyltransferase
LKIIFCGEDRFSAAVLNALVLSGYQIELIVSPFYNNLIYKKLERVANLFAIPFLRFENIEATELISKVSNAKPDLLITCHFQKILPGNIISIPKLGCINLHPSLLPKYRGMAPQHWPIIFGDLETGITVHFIDQNIDCGNVIFQKKLTLEENWYVSDLQEKMLQLYPEIMLHSVNLVCEGFAGYQQDHSQASYFGRLRVSDVTIKVDTPVKLAHQIIKAASAPYFGARFQDAVIWRANRCESDFENFKFDFGLNHFHGNTYLKLIDGVLHLENFNIL